MTININIGDISPLNVVSASYSTGLNTIGEYEVKLDGAGSLLRTETDTANENEVQFYRNGTLEFAGYVEKRESLEGGGIIILGNSILRDFSEVKCPVDSGKQTKTYTSTDDDTVFADLVGEVSGWSSDVTGSTATSIDAFRVNSSMSVWNGIIALLRQTNKDLEVDWATKTLSFVDQAGSTSAFTLEAGKNVSSVKEAESRQPASKVVVYGKGDGSFQITGSAGSGTPVKEVIDRNIISATAANQRATSELALVSSGTKTYSFRVTNPNLDVELGDEGTLTATSAGFTGSSVAITRITRELLQTGSETLSLEVTNTDYRVAKASVAEQQAIAKANNIVSESTMLGSGNLLTWGSGINAKSTAPLKVGFYVSSQFEDEAGNLRIESMTLDYDVDPYKKQFGTASYDGADPQVQNTSGDEAPNVSGTSASSSVDTDFNYDEELDATGGSNIVSVSGPFVTGDGDVNIIHIWLSVNRGALSSSEPGYNAFVENSSTNTTYLDVNDICTQSNSWSTSFIVSGDIEGDTISYLITDNGNGGVAYAHGISVSTMAEHDHADGTYAAVNHGHPDGSYDINAADLDDISVGDDVSDAASITTTSITWYLDYYNGSSWVNKATGASGAAQATDIDITDGGTYPDSTGYWRVRLFPDATSPDFVQGIVRLKHNIDN